MPPRAWQILPAVAALVLPQAAAQAPSAQVTAYEQCAVKLALRWAPGPDSADLIASAALDSCATERRAIAEMVRKSGSTDSVMLAMIEQINSQFKKEIVGLILDFRAGPK